MVYTTYSEKKYTAFGWTVQTLPWAVGARGEWTILHNTLKFHKQWSFILRFPSINAE